MHAAPSDQPFLTFILPELITQFTHFGAMYNDELQCIFGLADDDNEDNNVQR